MNYRYRDKNGTWIVSKDYPTQAEVETAAKLILAANNSVSEVIISQDTHAIRRKIDVDVVKL